MNNVFKTPYADLATTVSPVGGELHYELEQNGKKFKFVLKHLPAGPDEPDCFWGRVLHEGHVIDEHESWSVCDCLQWLCDSVSAYEGGTAWN